ncbi:hypothetical protein GCM10027280_30310 [Micromonospora polyrhachis]|uniref:Uncharacterized protein n=1 Tax=Micromonospora polyrhachis TaxID=1282883 RepID=A0A7W7SU91_9ACTN|nr:hypothetical protein [Micromonospora polyrhachis]MBB4961063.1 hypothetical protein [Micromonospora polyrhachis]
MSDLEQLLQQSLARHADEAPSSGQLLSRLQVRTRQRQRRQMMALAAGLTMALCVLVVGVQRWPDGPDHAVVYEPAVAPVAPVESSLSSSGVPSPGASVALVLQPGPLMVDAFPFTPTRELPGLQPTVQLVEGVPTIRYDGPEGGVHWATVSVGAVEPRGMKGAAQSFKVRGRTVNYVSLPPGAEGEWTMWWQEGAAQWITVQGSATVTIDDLLGYVEGMTSRPMPVVSPFTFEYVSANLTVDSVAPSMITFRPADAPPGAGFEFELVVLFDEAFPTAAGRSVRVGQQRGVLYQESGHTILSVQQPDQRAITIQLPSNITVSEPDLFRFAAGIRSTPAAVPGKG